MDVEKKYWFSAKRYGWGWGLPSRWEGWVVLVAFIALLVAGSFVLPPDQQLGRYLAWVFLITVLFLAVVRAKGESPRWRWGNDADS